jgi:CspA family cold shock protein
LTVSKHHRSRQSRGHGFNDDFAYDRAPAMDGPGYSSSSSVPAGFGPELGATVKWFNAEKGFGFVELSDGSGDVFLHINALTTLGHSTVSPGAVLRVRVGPGKKGRQVSEVISIDNSTAEPGRAPAARAPAGPRNSPDPSSAVEMQGTVKMYNAAKGFGFIAVPSGSKDVFVHASALQRSGLAQLSEGQSVLVGVVQGGKGPEALSVKLA